ncbi:MAG: GntR family transcriptional regulator [Oscillospiraceae bacterium]|nr:GntR family transcriptional regulator [Oscillospiraceae bacterium]
MAELDYMLSSVSKSNKGPVSKQIVDLIIKNVEMKILSPGDKLPTERELAERLGVSRGTVKAANKKLEQQNVIRTRQGSGSYVIRDEELSQKLRKERASLLLNRTIMGLAELGISTAEMSRLFEACLAQTSKSAVSVALVFDSAEALLDLKVQLSYLPNVAVSIFILETITENSDPEELLRGFDLIITPSRHYQRILELLPKLKAKVIEAAIAPSNETLIKLTAFPRDSRFGIICRTNVFLAAVKELLLSYGFLAGNILSFFEMDYTTDTYFPGGIDVLVTFSDAHIFTNPAFNFRNKKFWEKGGKFLVFKQQFERGTLIYIENFVRRISSQVQMD